MASIPTGAVSSTSYSSAPSGSAGATYKNASGALINSAGQTVGGAVTSKGLSYNGTDIIPGSSVYVKDAQGIPGYSGAISNSNTQATIPATTIGNTAAYNIPAPVTQDWGKLLNLPAGGQADTTAYNKASGSTGSDSGMNSPFDVTKFMVDAINNNPAPSNVQAVKDIYGYNLAEDQAKKKANEQQVLTKTQELNSIVNNRDAQLLSLRQVGSENNVTEAIYGGQQTTINREAAIKALPVQAELAAAQGNLALAEKHLDTFFNAQLQDNKNEFDRQSKIIDVVSQGASKTEQRQFDALQLANKYAHDQVVNNTDEVQAWSKLAMASGQSNLISSLTSLDPKSDTFQKDLGAIQAKIQRADKYAPVKDLMGNITGAFDSTTGTFKNISGATISSSDLKSNPDLATNTINQTNPIITIGANGLPIVAHPPTGNPIVDQAQQLVDGNAVPSTTRPSKLDYAVQTKANELSIAQTGKPYSAVDAAAAYRFRNSSTYQKFIANAPVAMSTINAIVDDVRKLNLSGPDALNSAWLKLTGAGLNPMATQDERATAKELINTLGSISADDIGLLLGSGSGSDYKTKLGGAIFDVSGNLQTTDQIAATVNARIQSKLNDYYRIAGIKDPSIYAARDAQAITGVSGITDTTHNGVALPSAGGNSYKGITLPH